MHIKLFVPIVCFLLFAGMQKPLSEDWISPDPDSLIGSVSEMLSDITSLAGVVTVPRGQQATLRQIEFLPLSDNRILAILVINDHEVQNRILHVDRAYEAYDEHPLDEPDAWGDLASFREAAGRS